MKQISPTVRHNLLTNIIPIVDKLLQYHAYMYPTSSNQ